MTLRKSLIAGLVAVSGAAAVPAFAEVSVSIGLGIPLPPPAVIYEAPPPAPAYGYVWVPGYWGWHGDRYVWIRGRHVYGRPGYAWAPDHWVQRGDRWHHVQGGWHRDKQRHRDHRGRGHDRH